MKRAELIDLYADITVSSMDYSELEMFVYNAIAEQLEKTDKDELIDKFYKDICMSRPADLWDIGRTVLTKEEVQSYLASKQCN
jgi:hypothetical protein